MSRLNNKQVKIIAKNYKIIAALIYQIAIYLKAVWVLQKNMTLWIILKLIMTHQIIINMIKILFKKIIKIQYNQTTHKLIQGSKQI